MRRVVLTLAVLFALAGAPAQAGTYDVVACNAPGANGVNRSWTTVVYSWPTVSAQPELFDFHTTCSSGLGVSSHAPEQRLSNYTNSGGLRFTAPAVPRSSRFARTATTRCEAAPMTRTRPILKTAIGRSSCTARGVRWAARSVASSASPRVLASAPGAPSPEGDGTDPRRAAVDADVGDLLRRRKPRVLLLERRRRLQVLPLGSFWLYGATVALEDNSALTAALGGDLLSRGWRRPTIRSPGRRPTTPASAGASCSSTTWRWPPAAPTAIHAPGTVRELPRVAGRVRSGRGRAPRVQARRHCSAGNPTTVARPSTWTAPARPRRHPSERQDDHGRCRRQRIRRGGRHDLGAQLAG